MKIDKGLSEEVLEKKHVHKIYDDIATHFSQTRYKPWPVITDFLERLPVGSLVGDIGCGNGKYMSVNEENLFYIGCDRSGQLLNCAKDLHGKFEFALADNLALPFKDNTFDHLISIAVIHHLSSHQRRVDGVRELLRTLKPKGTLLIFAWAFEQTESSKRKFDDQDVLVSWKKNDDSSILYRYYHLFKQGELEQVVKEACTSKDSEVTATGYDKDNWFVVVTK